VRIAMIGGGYVGLVSGACLAEFGTEVIVVEVDPTKLNALKLGRAPIYEPGLDDLVAKNVKAGRLSFTDELSTAVKTLRLFLSPWERQRDAAMGTPI
jgi:UDPglucose 6-dehydrogenase